MAKKRRNAKKQSHIQAHGSGDELFGPQDLEETLPSYYDEIDDYNLEREEKLLLEDECVVPRAYGQKEVLEVGDDSEDDKEEKDGYHFDPDDDDNFSDGEYQDSDVEKKQQDMASDIEDSDDDIPDVKAWGKKKSVYYNTDYIDQGYRDCKESDIEAAEAEEKEVLALEKRLTEEMQESDFGLEWLEKMKPQKQIEEKIKIDLHSLSKEEKLEHLKRNSPELLEFHSEFIAKLTELQEKLQPAVTEIKENKISPGHWQDYILIKYQTILQYCTNISFYFILKTKGVQTSDHPVIKRIQQFGKLLKDLDSIEIQPLSTESESIVEEMQHESPIALEDPIQDVDERDNEVEEHMNTEEEFKREITYEIAKNKGMGW